MKLFIFLVSLLCAAFLSVNANAQAVARIVWTCDGCIENGKLTDADLEGALFMHQLGSGTYFMVFDGFAGRSITYVATVVNSLDYPWQPNRELPRGQYLVMKFLSGPHPAPELERAMFNFYQAAPVGWSKDFVPSSQIQPSIFDSSGLGHLLLQSTPIPIAELTFPHPSVNVYTATMGGVAQNAVLSWANGGNRCPWPFERYRMHGSSRWSRRLRYPLHELLSVRFAKISSRYASSKSLVQTRLLFIQLAEFSRPNLKGFGG